MKFYDRSVTGHFDEFILFQCEKFNLGIFTKVLYGGGGWVDQMHLFAQSRAVY